MKEFLNNTLYHDFDKKLKTLELPKGIVIVYGESDDLVEFYGAINDELYCYDKGQFYITSEGLLESCESNCTYYQKTKETAKVLKVFYNDDMSLPCWTFETDIPHETFDILEEDYIFCRGIIFDLNNLN